MSYFGSPYQPGYFQQPEPYRPQMQQAVGGMMQSAMAKMPSAMNLLANPQQVAQQYKQFRDEYKGDAQAEVEQMIRDGKLSNQQLQQLQMLSQMLPKV